MINGVARIEGNTESSLSLCSEKKELSHLKVN
jgi:hypothetical protein